MVSLTVNFVLLFLFLRTTTNFVLSDLLFCLELNHSCGSLWCCTVKIPRWKFLEPKLSSTWGTLWTHVSFHFEDCELHNSYPLHLHLTSSGAMTVIEWSGNLILIFTLSWRRQRKNENIWNSHFIVLLFIHFYLFSTWTVFKSLCSLLTGILTNSIA